MRSTSALLSGSVAFPLSFGGGVYFLQFGSDYGLHMLMLHVDILLRFDSCSCSHPVRVIVVIDALFLCSSILTLWPLKVREKVLKLVKLLQQFLKYSNLFQVPLQRLRCSLILSPYC